MNLWEIMEAVEARIKHLEPLRQPGAVDLGPDDNAVDQDALFAELAALESIAAHAYAQYGAIL